LNAFDLAGEGVGLVESDRRVRGNLVAITKWAQGAADPSAEPVTGSASGHSRRLTVRFWLRPTEILGTERVEGITLERTAISADGKFGGTGEFETLDAQMVLRSVGYQSVPLPGVPFDSRASVVPNAQGRVLGEDGAPLPGEYAARPA
jgi:ferredoxin/flavodoxin---NADP+ reductase